MRVRSLTEVLEQLKFERAEAERRLINLDITISTLMALHSEPEKPVEKLPLFTVSKAAPVQERVPRVRLATGETRRIVLEVLRDYPGIKVAAVRKRLTGVLTPKTVANALGRLKREGRITLNKGIYRLTSGTTDPAPSPADPAQSPAPE
jgi:hypothetical protein